PIRARKEAKLLRDQIANLPDDLPTWIAWYLSVAVDGVRDPAVTRKIDLHLSRFCQFIEDCYSESRISLVLKRDVLGFRTYLDEEISFARSTTNNHLASLSGFCVWVPVHGPDLFDLGNPCQGVG